MVLPSPFLPSEKRGKNVLVLWFGQAWMSTAVPLPSPFFKRPPDLRWDKSTSRVAPQQSHQAGFLRGFRLSSGEWVVHFVPEFLSNSVYMYTNKNVYALGLLRKWRSTDYTSFSALPCLFSITIFWRLGRHQRTRELKDYILFTLHICM